MNVRTHARQRRPPAFGKHDGDLLEVITDNVNCVQFSSAVFRHLTRDVCRDIRGWSKVGRQENSIQTDFSGAAAMMDKVMLRWANREHRTRRFSDDLFDG